MSSVSCVINHPTAGRVGADGEHDERDENAPEPRMLEGDGAVKRGGPTECYIGAIARISSRPSGHGSCGDADRALARRGSSLEVAAAASPHARDDRTN